MRKIVFYGAVSLDGYLAKKDDSLQWLFDTDTGAETTYKAFFEDVDTVVMGRITYQATKQIIGEEAIYPDTQTIVFSRSQDKFYEDAIGESGDPIAYLTKLREQPGQMIWIVGGGNFIKPIIEADLIDEWWIQIAPVLLGDGKPLFEKGDYAQRLKLVDTKIMGELVELHYVRKQES